MREGMSINRDEIRVTKTEDRYLADFNLELENIGAKKILDIGAGDSADFVRYCLEHGIKGIYGLDARPLSSEASEDSPDIKDHYVRGELEHLPFKPATFDLILMRAVINPETDVNVEGALSQTLETLSPGGELMIYPVWREKEERVKIDQALLKLDHDKFSWHWQEKEILPVQGKELHKDLLVIKKQIL